MVIPECVDVLESGRWTQPFVPRMSQAQPYQAVVESWREVVFQRGSKAPEMKLSSRCAETLGNPGRSGCCSCSGWSCFCEYVGTFMLEMHRESLRVKSSGRSSLFWCLGDVSAHSGLALSS